jgi:hypothetical protein
MQLAFQLSSSGKHYYLLDNLNMQPSDLSLEFLHNNPLVLSLASPAYPVGLQVLQPLFRLAYTCPLLITISLLPQSFLLSDVEVSFSGRPCLNPTFSTKAF